MRQFFEKIHGAIKNFMVNIVLRKVFIPLMLTFTYIVFIGVFGLLAKVFSRKMLNPGSMNEQSFWVKAEGNEPDAQKLLRQS